MSATNQTSNYELPLFIGTDKPSWLGDFNGAMNAIDTAIKGRADDIGSLETRMTATETVANTASSNASTALTNASNAATAASSAQSTADSAATAASAAQTTANTGVSNAATAQTTANTANSTAQSALTLANSNAANIAKFNLTTFADIAYTDITTTYGSINSGSNVSVAKNSDGSLAKIYGNVIVNNPNVGSTTLVKVTIPTSLRPESNFTIKNAGIKRYVNSTSVQTVSSQDITVKTTGDVEIEFNAFSDTSSITVMLMPCLYWVKDFGDTPTPEA